MKISSSTAVASMRRTEALASVKFYQILSIFIFFIRLIILEDFIRLISYNGPCVRLGCSFFLATALSSDSQDWSDSGHLSRDKLKTLSLPFKMTTLQLPGFLTVYSQFVLCYKAASRLKYKLKLIRSDCFKDAINESWNSSETEVVCFVTWEANA